MTIEISRRIWDDSEGVCIEVRPDQDGLDTIEIFTPDVKSTDWFGPVRFSVPKELARQLGEALIAAAQE